MIPPFEIKRLWKEFRQSPKAHRFVGRSVGSDRRTVGRCEKLVKTCWLKKVKKEVIQLPDDVLMSPPRGWNVNPNKATAHLFCLSVCLSIYLPVLVLCTCVSDGYQSKPTPVRRSLLSFVLSLSPRLPAYLVSPPLSKKSLFSPLLSNFMLTLCCGFFKANWPLVVPLFYPHIDINIDIVKERDKKKERDRETLMGRSIE